MKDTAITSIIIFLFGILNRQHCGADEFDNMNKTTTSSNTNAKSFDEYDFEVMSSESPIFETLIPISLNEGLQAASDDISQLAHKLVENFDSSREEEFGKSVNDFNNSEDENEAFFAKNIRNTISDNKNKKKNIENGIENKFLSTQPVIKETEATTMFADNSLKQKINSFLSNIKSSTEQSFNADTPVDVSSQNLPLCLSINEIPTFIRHSIVTSEKLAPSFAHNLDSLSKCADMCRQNVEPFDGQYFKCQGYIYSQQDTLNLCELYDKKASLNFTKSNSEKNSKNQKFLMPQSTRPLYRHEFFERVCLTIPDECGKSAFSFEKVSMKLLPIEPVEIIEVETWKRCLDFCLTNLACRSVNYNIKNGTCQVLDRGWRFTVDKLQNDANFEYFENTCFQENNRCTPQRRIDFLITKNIVLETFNLFADTQLNIQNCMRRCIESSEFFCRSFQYNYKTQECFVGVEGFYLDKGASLTAAIASKEFDLYEPVCLDESVDLPCYNMHVFERIPNMNLANNFEKGNQSTGQEIPNVTVETCMDICMYEVSCLSFVYFRTKKECKILSLTRLNTNLTLVILEPLTDYYELACERGSISQDLKTDLPLSLNEFLSAKEPNLTKFVPLLKINETTVSSKKMFNDENNVKALDIQIDNINAVKLENFKVITKDDNIELLENSEENCKNKTKSTQNTGILIDGGRTLRLAYRNLHHINVKSLSQCNALCRESSINCQTFAYNAISYDCLLSITPIQQTNSRFVMYTQPNTNYDLYALNKNSEQPNKNISCGKKNDNNNEVVEQHLSTEQFVPLSTQTNNPRSLNNIKEFTVTMFLENQQDSNSTKIYNIEKKTTEENTKLTTLQPVFRKHKTESSQTIKGLSSVELNNEELPRKISSLRQLNSANIQVNAMCLSLGVNVTFKLINNENYTGVVYGAERFAKCQTIVKELSAFSIFIYRPSVKNLCNALEIDGKLTAIIVLSNDMVLPFDVTTKDDLFYHISCNYNSEHKNKGLKLNESKNDITQFKESSENTGTVARGPKPKFVISSKRRPIIVNSPNNINHEMRVVLRILRNGHAVQNVYIGEKLMAFVMANDIDSNRLTVAYCNASRVGGQQPNTNSIQLIDKGCSLMPHFIGNMRRIEKGFEAPFTAFRIDGSDQIDIICSVVVCRNWCNDINDEICQKIRIKRNTTKLIQTTPYKSKNDLSDDNADMITVNQRLRVIVTEDDVNTDNDKNNNLQYNDEDEDEDEDNDLDTSKANLLDRIDGTHNWDLNRLQHNHYGNKFNDYDRQEDEKISVNEPPAAPSLQQPHKNSPSNLLNVLMHMESATSTEYCINPLVMIGLLALLALCFLGLLISLITSWCHRRRSYNSPSFIYSTGTELSNGTIGASAVGGSNFYIPRVNRYMA